MIRNRLGYTYDANKVLLSMAVLCILSLTLFALLLRSNATIRTLNKQLTQTQRSEIIAFGEQFVEKVLKAEKEVDFDTRLKLENDVRELEDNDLKAQWDKFTASKTEQEAQQEVKNLLSLLFKKLK